MQYCIFILFQSGCIGYVIFVKASVQCNIGSCPTMLWMCREQRSVEVHRGMAQWKVDGYGNMYKGVMVWTQQRERE